MGNRKQKWREEEERALVEGISKYGLGKWSFIKNDPLFSTLLKHRTNVDLKDKWRNMNAALLGPRLGSKTPNPKLTQVASAASSVDTHTPPVLPHDAPAVSPVDIHTPPVLPQDAPAASPIDIHTRPVLPFAHEAITTHVNEEPVKDIITVAKDVPRIYYGKMIFEALALAKEENGMDIESIFGYIKTKITIDAPSKFRQQLMSRLKRLAQNGRLEKVEDCYRLKTSSVAKTKKRNPKHILPSELLEVAAKTAAHKVAEAEEKIYSAALSVREAERLSKMQEEADSNFQFAQEIFKICHSNKFLLVA